MSRWESRVQYRKICTVPPHPAARSGLWDIPAGDQLSFLQHEDDNTIWRVPEHDRLYDWVPAGPYEYNVQFRDILPIARVAQIYCGSIQWVRSLLEVPETGEALLDDFKYTKRFLTAQATLAMKFMERFPHLPSELPKAHPEIEQRKDWLTDEVFQTMQKSLQLRNVTVRDFWKWLWPLRAEPSFHKVTHGPVSQTEMEDICERASCSDLIDVNSVPDWFMTRMRKYALTTQRLQHTAKG